MDPQRRGWVRVGEEGDESSSSRRSSNSSSSSTNSGERTPPAKTPKTQPPPPPSPKKPRTPRHFESSEEDAPRQARAESQGLGQGPPPQTPAPPPLENGPIWKCAGCGGHPVCPLIRGGQWGDRQPSDGFGGLG